MLPQRQLDWRASCLVPRLRLENNAHIDGGYLLRRTRITTMTPGRVDGW